MTGRVATSRHEIVGKETVVKRIIFALTAVACFGAVASQAMAQYPAQPQYRQPYAPYGAPAVRPAGGYQAARPAAAGMPRVRSIAPASARR